MTGRELIEEPRVVRVRCIGPLGQANIFKGEEAITTKVDAWRYFLNTHILGEKYERMESAHQCRALHNMTNGCNFILVESETY